MLVVISYDVNTESKMGRNRLRRIAKVCLSYGIRVQHSVFECQIDSVQLVQLRSELCALMNVETDSIRIYRLGSQYQSKVEHYGVKVTPDLSSDVIII